MHVTIGYAFVFENTVMFGQSIQDLLSATRTKRTRRKHGEYVGTVKGLIPVDPYHVIYFYHKHTEAFKKRQRLRKFLRRHHITKIHMNQQNRIDKFLP